MLKNLVVEEVVACAGTAWVLTGTPRVFDAVRWQALAQVREREGKLMRAFSAGRAV